MTRVPGYEQGYRDGEHSREADIIIAFTECESMDDLLAQLRGIAGDPTLEWP